MIWKKENKWAESTSKEFRFHQFPELPPFVHFVSRKILFFILPWKCFSSSLHPIIPFLMEPLLLGIWKTSSILLLLSFLFDLFTIVQPVWNMFEVAFQQSKTSMLRQPTVLKRSSVNLQLNSVLSNSWLSSLMVNHIAFNHFPAVKTKLI